MITDLKKNLLAEALIAAALSNFGDVAFAQVRYQPTPDGIRRAIVEGKIKEALASYELQGKEAEESATASTKPEKFLAIAVNAWTEASRAARLMGDLQKALTYAERAFGVAQKTENPALQLRALNQNLHLQNRLANYERMAELTDRGFALVRKLTSEVRKLDWNAILLSQAGRLAAARREYQKAIDAHSQALQSLEMYLATLSDQNPSHRSAIQSRRGNVVYTLYNLGESYRLAGKLDNAFECIAKAFQLTERWGVIHTFENHLYNVLGEIYLERKDVNKALESFHRAVGALERQKRAVPVFSTLSRIGDVLSQSGKPLEAISYYQKAIAEVESARSLLEFSPSRQSFFETGLSAYRGLIAALVKTGSIEDAFDFSERARSRDFLDLLGNRVRLSRAQRGAAGDDERAFRAEMAQITGASTDTEGGMNAANLRDTQSKYDALLARVRVADKERASLMNVEPLSLKEVQALLDAGQSLVQYFVAPEQTYIWIVQRSSVKEITVALPEAVLAKRVTALRSAISDLAAIKEYQSLASDLYHLLIEPILPHVRGELIVVPHGVLHYLPFQALYSPRRRYLIEDHAITYLSSASLLSFVREKRRHRADNVLAFSSPELSKDLNRLTFADVEVADIVRMFPKSAVFSRTQATESKFKALARHYDVIHVATHGELDEKNPLLSRILLAQSATDDGKLEVREIFEMELNAALVVLSACETALGKLSSGDEFVGLTRAFIYAGTPSVVASLWKVDDASTAALMSSFYRNLKTRSKVESLRQAQLDMIRGKVNIRLLAQRGVGGVAKIGQASAAESPGTVPTSHPYFWAPFILLGDGK